MYRKYKFMWADNNNCNSRVEYVILKPHYDFGDYLDDQKNMCFENVGDTYYIIKGNDRTGETYRILSVEEIAGKVS